MLKQVQRNAFAGEQYISKTARARDDFARFDLFAVRRKCFELLLWIECGKDFLSSFESGNDHLLARHESPFRARVSHQNCLRGDIATTEILTQK